MKPKILKPKSVSISKEAKFGRGVTIGPNVVIEGECVIGDKVTIGANSVIVKSSIDSGTKIFCSVIEESKIGANCSLGPFAHLRPHSTLSDGVTIGNFVEVKNSSIGRGSKAAHLAYIGDADIGENVNIGCGAIFVNYNGREKNRTVVGDESFIGSNCNIIAPVVIAERTYICAGTTLTQSTQKSDFVIGRVRQEAKPGKAENYLKKR